MKFDNFEKAQEIAECIESTQYNIKLCKAMIKQPSVFKLNIEEKDPRDKYEDYLCIKDSDQATFIKDIATTLLAKYEQEEKDLIAEFERIE